MDVLELIRTTDRHDPARIAAEEGELLDELRYETANRIAASSPRRSSKGRRFAFLSGAAALAVAVAVAALLSAARQTAPADALELLARAADAAGPSLPGPGKYLYRHVVGMTGFVDACEGCPGLVRLEPLDDGTWVGSDGTVVSLSKGQSEPSVRGGDGEVPLWRSWPDDPDAVWAELSGVASQHGDFGQQVFAWAGDALADPGTSPGVRRALFRVLRRAPGIEVDEVARDGLGRAAVAVAHSDGDFTERFLFDPTDASYVGRDLGDGTWDAVQSEGIVDAVGVLPA